MSMLSPLTELAQGLTMGFTGNLVALLVIIVLGLVITRNTQKLKIVLFPIALGLLTAGFRINILLMVILGIYFVFMLFKETKLFQEYITLNRAVSLIGKARGH